MQPLVLTLDQVRRFISDGLLPSFTSEELRQIEGWLNDLCDEIESIKHVIRAERHEVKIRNRKYGDIGGDLWR